MTYTVASSITVVTQFVVSFTIPYLLYAPYANLGAKICLIFAPIAVCTLLFAVFCVPECRGLSLEQIDQLFQRGVPVRKFGKYRGSVMAGGEVGVEGKGEEIEGRVEEREVVAKEG